LKQSLVDYNIKLNSVSLLCDNESAMKITKNPVLHSRTKHIDIRHHFLREKEANRDIALQNIRFEEQLVDIFTKPLNERIFVRLRNELNILDAAHVM
jgi:kynurenine formamidase